MLLSFGDVFSSLSMYTLVLVKSTRCQVLIVVPYIASLSSHDTHESIVLNVLCLLNIVWKSLK